MKVSLLLTSAMSKFSDAGIETPRLDAEVLLAHVLNTTRAGLLASLQDEVSSSKQALFSSLVSRRQLREPIAYIVGKKEFWSLDINVEKGVLIPRPETEHVVEQALILAKSRGKAPSILDLCTGSGCVAVALAEELPLARITASDVSDDAVKVAKKNLARFGNRVRVLTGDLFSPIGSEAFDIITANPPYIPDGDENALAPEIKEYEPGLALFSGKDGLDFIRRMVKTAASHLNSGGALIFEFGFGEENDVRAIGKTAGFSVEIHKDLSGIDRVAMMRKQPSGFFADGRALSGHK